MPLHEGFHFIAEGKEDAIRADVEKQQINGREKCMCVMLSTDSSVNYV